MGRLIDADKLRYKHSLNMVNTTMPQSFPCITKDEINNAPTVEAIPKADYETRLKADLVAMLTELQLEIEECVDGAEGSPQFEQGVTTARVQVIEIIQQKINALKETKMFEVEEMEGCHSCRYGENFDTEKEPCKYCYGLSLYTKKENELKEDQEGA